MILTSVVGMILSQPGLVTIASMVWGNLGIALMAASAASINHIVDKRIDIKMDRTSDRPVAVGRISTGDALVFSMVLCSLGMGILWFFNNPLAAWLTLATLVGYALIYSIYLKHATSQNIVIGGLSGAMPPLLGWVAVQGDIHPNALLLVLIIFIWTPPHFWALALHRSDEYSRANIPILTVTHGERYTRIQVLLYTLLLGAITLLPWVLGMFSWIYLSGAIVLGAVFIYWSIRVLLNRDNDTEADLSTFRYSIVYLMSLFAFMVGDHYLI